MINDLRYLHTAVPVHVVGTALACIVFINPNSVLAVVQLLRSFHTEIITVWHLFVVD